MSIYGYHSPYLEPCTISRSDASRTGDPLMAPDWRAKAGTPFAGITHAMPLRVLFGIVTTAVLIGGFALRSSAPAKSVEAVSSVPVLAAERQHDSVSVLTEVVTAQTVTSPSALPAPSGSQRAWATTPPASLRTARAQKRSPLARFLLGSGDSRPEPFPRPGRSVSARP